MKSICKVRSRLEGFLGPFFSGTAGILVAGTQRPRRPRRHRTSRGLTRLHGVHSGTGHHGASQGFTAAQGFTAPLKASRGLMASPGLLSGPGVRCASLELHSQAAHFGPGT